MKRCEICNRRIWPWQWQEFECTQGLTVCHCGRPRCKVVAGLRVAVADLDAVVQKLAASLAAATDGITAGVRRRVQG